MAKAKVSKKLTGTKPEAAAKSATKKSVASQRNANGSFKRQFTPEQRSAHQDWKSERPNPKKISEAGGDVSADMSSWSRKNPERNRNAKSQTAKLQRPSTTDSAERINYSSMADWKGARPARGVHPKGSGMKKKMIKWASEKPELLAERKSVIDTKKVGHTVDPTGLDVKYSESKTKEHFARQEKNAKGKS